MVLLFVIGYWYLVLCVYAWYLLLSIVPGRFYFAFDTLQERDFPF